MGRKKKEVDVAEKSLEELSKDIHDLRMQKVKLISHNLMDLMFEGSLLVFNQETGQEDEVVDFFINGCCLELVIRPVIAKSKKEKRDGKKKKAKNEKGPKKKRKTKTRKRVESVGSSAD